MKEKLFAAGLYLATAASMIMLVIHVAERLLEPIGHDLGWTYRAAEFAFLGSNLLLAFAALHTFFNPRSAYFIGLSACLMALPWFLWTESFLFKEANSWIEFNVGDAFHEDGLRMFAGLRIVAVAMLVITAVLSALRLLPIRWLLRGRYVRERTWPAFAVAAAVLVVWYSVSISPYRVPVIVDAVQADLRILHVEKQGLQFRETSIAIYRDQRFWISRTHRHFFQYRADVESGEGSVPDGLVSRVSQIRESPEVQDIDTLPVKPLRSWNAEGWYVAGIGRHGPIAFTSEYGTKPPAEIVDLFNTIQALAIRSTRRGEIRDICFGFCYDPLAGLGIEYINQRCGTDQNATRCW